MYLTIPNVEKQEEETDLLKYISEQLSHRVLKVPGTLGAGSLEK